ACLGGARRPAAHGVRPGALRARARPPGAPTGRVAASRGVVDAQPSAAAACRYGAAMAGQAAGARAALPAAAGGQPVPVGFGSAADDLCPRQPADLLALLARQAQRAEGPLA